jgi:hypothetical protein
MMSEPNETTASVLRDAGYAVVAYWDSLDAVGSEDTRPSKQFVEEMDRRVAALRAALEEMDVRVTAFVQSLRDDPRYRSTE